MKAASKAQKRYTLMGLLLAFVLSSVVFPAFGAPQDQNADNKLHLTADADAHSSQGIPLTMAEEKEEEENRTDKNHAFTLSLFSVVFEKIAVSPAEPTTWAFNHTNTSALTNFPIYLAQHLLLI